MKRKVIAILCVASVCLQCTATSRYAGDRLSRETPALNRKLHNKKVDAVTGTGRTFVAKNLTFSRDSVFFVDPASRRLESMPISAVKELRYKSRGQGALKGLAAGGLLGMLSGAVAGFASGDDPPGWFSMTASEKAAMGAMALGTLGGLAGLIIGGRTGSNIYLLFSDTSIEVDRIIQETGRFIEIEWRERKITLPKSQIRVVRTDSACRISMPDSLFEARFPRAGQHVTEAKRGKSARDHRTALHQPAVRR